MFASNFVKGTFLIQAIEIYSNRYKNNGVLNEKKSSNGKF